jgi:hypothetical protein
MTRQSGVLCGNFWHSRHVGTLLYFAYIEIPSLVDIYWCYRNSLTPALSNTGLLYPDNNYI